MVNKERIEIKGVAMDAHILLFCEQLWARRLLVFIPRRPLLHHTILIRRNKRNRVIVHIDELFASVLPGARPAYCISSVARIDTIVIHHD